MSRKLVILVNLFLLLMLTRIGNGQSSVCIVYETCGKCLLADPSCAWCVDRDYDMRKARCMTKSDLLNANCRLDDILENQFTPIEYLENKKPKDYSKDSLDAVQFQPQKVKLKLQKSRTQTVKMTFKPAKNYPLDLYYLMDLTWSMRDDKATLVNMGQSIANALSKLTENYRLGYGSFADKPSMPFIYTGEKELKNPCAPVHDVCEPTYGFRHRLTLTNNIKGFIEKVNSSGITGNQDNLEGGLDALMQILVCGEKIGWSEKTRKIIIFASDGLMHFAGDGLLAGIVAKNDQHCYLSVDGEYFGSLHYDYPSLEEIYRILVKQKVSIIFAVTQDVIHHYDQIHNLLHEMSSVGSLKMDSSNILQLLENGYYEFVKKVQFFDNAPSYIRIDYETDCGGFYKTRRPQSRCNNVEIGHQYDFYVNVTLLDLPPDGKTREKIRIEESSISFEGLDLDIEIEAECSCMAEEIGEQSSRHCNYNGEMKCGTCFCDNGWSGKQCECNIQDYGSSKELDNNCRKPVFDATANSSILGALCSERGECFCGECYCNYGFSGKYCDCNECPYYKGQECGGSDRANCECGECICLPGWSGEKCDCTTSTLACTAPNSEKICSNRGDCKCGVCKCISAFSGAFCEYNTGADSALCSYYEPCVKCLIDRHEGSESCPDAKQICSSGDGQEFHNEFVSYLNDSNILCIIRTNRKDSDNEKCEHQYTYEVDPERTSHLKIRYNNCEPPNVAFLAMWIFFPLLLIGVLTILIFKYILVRKDKQEYAKFEETLKTEQHMMSPIYKSPITNYEVPQEYRLSQRDSSFEVMDSP